MQPMSSDFSLFQSSHEHQRKKSRGRAGSPEQSAKGTSFTSSTELPWRRGTQQHWRHFRGDALKSQRQQSHVRSFQPMSPLQLDSKAFAKCLREAPSGCSPGPGRCTNEMFRVCLDDHELFLLFSASEEFARGRTPPTVGRVLMVATMTALQKVDGG